MKKKYLFAFMMLCAIVGHAQNSYNQSSPFVETTASIDSLVVPDKIYLTIHLDEKDSKGKISIEELENKIEKALSASNIDLKKQLSLFNFGSDFSKYFLRKKDVSKTKTYKLLVYNAQEVSDVLLKLEKIKISNVSFLKAEYSKRDELMLKLKQKAVLKARNEAKNLAKPLNQEVGKAIFISDANSFLTLNYDNYGTNEVGLLSNSRTRIEAQFRKIKIIASVKVRFQLY